MTTTPTDIITAVQQWSKHVIDPSDKRMRAMMTAVLAMATAHRAGQAWQQACSAEKTGATAEWYNAFQTAMDAVERATAVIDRKGEA